MHGCNEPERNGGRTSFQRILLCVRANLTCASVLEVLLVDIFAFVFLKEILERR